MGKIEVDLRTGSEAWCVLLGCEWVRMPEGEGERVGKERNAFLYLMETTVWIE